MYTAVILVIQPRVCEPALTARSKDDLRLVMVMFAEKSTRRDRSPLGPQCTVTHQGILYDESGACPDSHACGEVWCVVVS